MLTDSHATPARRTTRQAVRRLRRRPFLVASTLTASLAIAATATAMAPAPGTAHADEPQVTFALASFSTALPQTLGGSADTKLATTVETAIAEADAAIAASSDVTKDITASKLEVAADDKTVDTSDLEAAD